MKLTLKALTLAVAISASYANADQIKIVGSDILKPHIASTLEAIAKKDNVKISMDMVGSYAAYESLNENSADIAIVAIPKSSKVPEGFLAFPIAYQTAIVIVNAINPLEEISTSQLFSIYSKNAAPRAETWDQIGVNNPALRNILPISTDFSDNIVVELFKYSAIKGSNLGPWVDMEDNRQVIYNMIRTNNSAIAVVGKLTDKNMIKVLAISNPESGKSGKYAFKPDSESIFNGDYPMVLPFYVIFKKENARKLKPLMKILLGDEIAHKINSGDFYAAPQNSRKKSIFELDILN